MINYFFESTVSLLILFVFYQLFLEREKMHQFNRFYLLFSIFISMIIPFVSIRVFQETETAFLPLQTLSILTSTDELPPETLSNYFPVILGIIYGIVFFVLFVRFFKNLIFFRKTIQNSEKVNYKNAVLVLLEGKTVPHTFLHFIFLSKDAYKNQSIESEIYEHELTHVNQKHSIDILFVEILKVIFWFNPMFIIYKKAIQINHEFIADAQVVKKHTNFSFYQSLLLHTNENTNDYLASNLNYLVTKKRLIMMTKTSSKVNVFIKKAGIIPLLTMMIYFLCADLAAQEQTKAEVKENSNQGFPNEALNAYYNETRVIFKDSQGKVLVDKNYKELSEQEKMKIPPPPPKPARISLSESQFNDFKNSTKYAVWIDGIYVQNTELNNYNAADFVLFRNSHVYKNARSKKFPQENQVRLYTEKSFVENFEKRNKMSGTIIISVNPD